VRARLNPGTAAEVLDGGSGSISPNKRLKQVEIIEIPPPGLRSLPRSCSATSSRAGHMEVHGLEERTGGITEFMPLSFIPSTPARPHPRSRGDLEGNLKHTAAFGSRGKSITAPELGQDGPRKVPRGVAWGVSLGGTLMESISRMAGSQHGVRLGSRASSPRRQAARPQRNLRMLILQRYPDRCHRSWTSSHRRQRPGLR
jgi:FO synthase